jgi:hypothetical protein
MGKGVLIALLIVAIGCAWLLNTLHVIAGVDWVWTLALGVTGVITLVWTRINKITFIMGLFLIIGSIFSVARQTGLLRIDVEVPLLVILFGILFLIAQLPIIPLPKTLVQIKEEEARRQEKISH